ncbi:MAG: glycosyltransferase family 2 protein [Legionellaceae bacterium]|nr:glycosyltransferase family 2 protein [Legionellaceae bacterium]
MKLSICIPTYNRAAHLVNCLKSINIAASSVSENILKNIEICISDNGSLDSTQDVASQANMILPVTYHRNTENIGIPRNFLKVIEIARGEFIWLLGDDDLLLPDSFSRLFELFYKYSKVDFFYVNASHLSTEYVLSFPQPFDTSSLPIMKPFSDRANSGEMNFLELIDPNVSFDFLGGMFLSVFKRENWVRHCLQLDSLALLSGETFSHFDNTFPHIKIFSKAFAESRAYFNAKPLVVCLSGAREWAPMYPFVRSIRLIEALKLYREAGLSFYQYIKCRNFALQNFIPDLITIFLNRKNSGLHFLKLKRHVLSNCIYPNVYFSPFLYVMKRTKSFFQRE